MSTQILNSRPEEITTGCFQDPQDPLCDVPEQKLHAASDPHKPLWWHMGHSDIFLELVPGQFRDSVQQSQ